MQRSWFSGIGLAISLTIALVFRTPLRKMRQEEAHYQHILRKANIQLNEE